MGIISVWTTRQQSRLITATSVQSHLVANDASVLPEWWDTSAGSGVGHNRTFAPNGVPPIRQRAGSLLTMLVNHLVI
jgi:hypothetical protein